MKLRGLPVDATWRGALASLTLLILIASCATSSQDKSAALPEERISLNLESFEVVCKTIQESHWDPNLGGLDWAAVHDETSPLVRNARTSRDYYRIMSGMLGRLAQSHLGIIPKEIYEKMSAPPESKASRGSIGLDLRVIDGKAVVTRVDEGFPAAASGVKPGWLILDVDGKKASDVIEAVGATMKDKTMQGLFQRGAIMGMLDGEVGAVKKIRFKDAANRRATLPLTLATPKGNRYSLGHLVAGSVWFESRRVEKDIGYIAFSAFLDPVNVMAEFEKAIQSFSDCRGIIIDIRGNPGGTPLVAMGMAGWLIASRDEFLGTMTTRDATLRFVVNPRPEALSCPVAVLIDESSASCAEIFAAGLHDIGRVRLFGSRTAGAVLPAHWLRLPNGDFFMYPVADYVSKNGSRLEAVGVGPDVEIRLTREDLLAGRDAAVQAAIDWIHGQDTAACNRTDRL